LDRTNAASRSLMGFVGKSLRHVEQLLEKRGLGTAPFCQNGIVSRGE
jgi:hypothetical protein